MMKILLLTYTITFAGVQNLKNKKLREFMNFRNKAVKKVINHMSYKVKS